VTEIWGVEKRPPAMQHTTQKQLEVQAHDTEGMLITTLAAIKATAEG
jgi:hypothetical protein